MRLDLEYMLQMGLEDYEDFDSFYAPIDSSIVDLHREQGRLFHGRNVIWLTSDVPVIRAFPDYTHAIAMNIFYPEKLAAAFMAMKEGDEKFYFFAPWGAVTLINENDVEESRRCEEEGELYESMGASTPYDEDDIGEYSVQIRDGNHRTWAAFLIGEPYVYVNVIEDYSMEDVTDYTE